MAKLVGDVQNQINLRLTVQGVKSSGLRGKTGQKPNKKQMAKMATCFCSFSFDFLLYAGPPHTSQF
jgi:hypothetical protein